MLENGILAHIITILYCYIAFCRLRFKLKMVKRKVFSGIINTTGKKVTKHHLSVFWNFYMCFSLWIVSSYVYVMYCPFQPLQTAGFWAFIILCSITILLLSSVYLHVCKIFSSWSCYFVEDIYLVPVLCLSSIDM